MFIRAEGERLVAHSAMWATANSELNNTSGNYNACLAVPFLRPVAGDRIKQSVPCGFAGDGEHRQADFGGCGGSDGADGGDTD